MMKDRDEFGDPPLPGETIGSTESLGDPPVPGEEEEEEGDPPVPGETNLPGGTGG